MLNGLKLVGRQYNGLLVPIARYTITNTLKETNPKILSSTSFDEQASLIDLQVDVGKTIPAINHVTAIFDNMIIQAFEKYDTYYINCYSELREKSKEWIDSFENKMIKNNQYRGKCLYAEKEQMYFKEVPKVSWDDVILSDKTKHDIRLNTSEFLGNAKYAAAGVTKRGLVMFGPPGTGKTSVVKAVFNDLENKNVSRIYVTAESFKYMPISQVFDFLPYLGPTVLAFEDIDFVGGNRDNFTASNHLGDLLTNLDGMRKFSDPLVTIASTNKIEMLDSALSSRPCRFDRRIEVGLPDSACLKKMYFKHLGKDVEDSIIHLSKDFTGSHVVETVNTAKILATNYNKQTIECLKEACEIIRDNFFPGQTTLQIQAAVKKHFNKKSNVKTASKKFSKVEEISLQILKKFNNKSNY